MRQKITVQSDVVLETRFDSTPEATTIFYCGEYSGNSFSSAVKSAIDKGDCNTDTRVILDGQDRGTLWQLGFVSTKTLSVIGSE